MTCYRPFLDDNDNFHCRYKVLEQSHLWCSTDNRRRVRRRKAILSLFLYPPTTCKSKAREFTGFLLYSFLLLAHTVYYTYSTTTHGLSVCLPVLPFPFLAEDRLWCVYFYIIIFIFIPGITQPVSGQTIAFGIWTLGSVPFLPLLHLTFTLSGML